MATTMSGLILLDKLDGKNYSTWKIRMKDIFTMKKLWKIVDRTTQTPATSSALTLDELKAIEKWIDEDQEVLTIIKMAVTDDCLSHVKDATTTKQAWDNLKAIYETVNESQVLYLRNKLHALKMSQGESITAHIAHIQNLKEQLRSVGETVRPKELVHITSNSLPRSYEMLITELTKASRFSTLTFEELSGMMVQQEQALKKYSSEESSSNYAFVAKWKGKQKYPS
eukprot:Gb_13937 [translate_table: standard]